MTHRLKSFALAAFLAICLAGTARSDVLTVGGQTSGEFGQPGIPGLSFIGTNFNETTNTAGNFYGVALGTFSYSAPIWSASTTTFLSTITIEVPTGTLPGTATQRASVSAVAVIGLGLATINFDNTPLHFQFSNSTGSGSFDLTIRDVALWDLTLLGGSSQILRGDITNAVLTRAPEVGTVELLLTLMAGVGYVLKKRVALYG